MIPKILISVVTMFLFQLQADSLCIPCPKRGITISSFTHCNCPLPTFHDDSTNKCVSYSHCPVIPFRDPLPELKTLDPFLYDVFSNISAAIKLPKLPTFKDISLVNKASKKSFLEVKRRIPEFFEEFVESILLENTELFETCKGNIVCVVREMLNRDNKELITSKLKSVLDRIAKTYYRTFDDLKESLKENCTEEECPFIRKILKWKEEMPERLEEFKDLQQIFAFFNKYFLGDFKKDLEQTNRLH